MNSNALKDVDHRLKFHDADIGDVFIAGDFGEHFRGRHAIEVEDGEGLAADFVAAEAHAGDVDVVLRLEGADVADHARAVFVVHEEQDDLGDDFDRAAGEADDARLMALAQDSAAGRDALLAGNGGDMNPFVVIRVFVGFDFLDDQAQGSGEGTDVDLVNLLASDTFQKAFEHHARDRVGGKLGSFASVGDDDLVVAFGGELGNKPAQLLRQVQIRLNQIVGLAIEVGEIDG